MQEPSIPRGRLTGVLLLLTLLAGGVFLVTIPDDAGVRTVGIGVILALCFSPCYFGVRMEADANVNLSPAWIAVYLWFPSALSDRRADCGLGSRAAWIAVGAALAWRRGVAVLRLREAALQPRGDAAAPACEPQ